MLIINFEGREAKGLSKGRYDESFAGEDAHLFAFVDILVCPQLCRGSIKKDELPSTYNAYTFGRHYS